MAKQTVETYLELLAEEIAEGDWVDIYGKGKIQVSIQAGSGAENLRQYLCLQSKIRRLDGFKRRIHQML